MSGLLLFSEQHPQITLALGIVAVWLAISLLSLVETPEPGGKLDYLCRGVRRWGIDLPGTAHWLREGLRRVLSVLEGRAFAQIGASAAVAAVEPERPPATPSDEMPTPIPAGDSAPVILPPPLPPGGAS
jgi:hypothetical protein